MEKKVVSSLKKTNTQWLSISCILLLLISLLPFTATANDINISDNINMSNSTSVSENIINVDNNANLSNNTSESNNISIDNKISGALSLKIAEASAIEKIPVIIVLANQQIAFNNVNGELQIESDQKNIIQLLGDAKSTNKAQEIKPIKLVNAVAAEVTPEVLVSLSKKPEVSKIELDEVVYLVDTPESSLKEIKGSSSIQNINIISANAWGVDKVGAPTVWQQGITGKGVTVAVVDTGIDVNHPDLDDLDENPLTNDPKVVSWIDYVNSYPSPYDDHGHGTHVAGTISGTGANGIRTGVAPGTKLIAAKVFSEEGYGYTSDVILAFEWAVNNNADIISYSGGSSHQEIYTTAINNVVAAGVVPVIAAGNSGPGSNTISCPGDEINSIAIGATDSSDTIAYFSSRGPVTLGGQTYIKPDVSAPGLNIISTFPGGGYDYMSGTSMATPHVSGTAALMLENNPSLTPSRVKQILEGTSVDRGSTGKDNSYGSGRINAYQAVFGTQKLVANFSATPISGNAPLKVLFTDTSTGGTRASWYWDFGDGINSKNARTATHTYTKSGTYTVTLTVKNKDSSSTVRKTNYISVTNLKPPVATFSANVISGRAPLTVLFKDTGTGGAPTSWYWDFGDGINSKHSLNATHTFTKAGRYTISLTVKNTRGSSTSKKTGYIVVRSK